MVEFLRLFGQGVFFTLISPFLAAVWLLGVAYSILNYIVYEIKNISSFFVGKPLNAPHPLETELEEKKADEAASALWTGGAK